MSPNLGLVDKAIAVIWSSRPLADPRTVIFDLQRQHLASLQHRIQPSPGERSARTAVSPGWLCVGVVLAAQHGSHIATTS